MSQTKFYVISVCLKPKMVVRINCKNDPYLTYKLMRYLRLKTFAYVISDDLVWGMSNRKVWSIIKDDETTWVDFGDNMPEGFVP